MDSLGGMVKTVVGGFINFGPEAFSFTGGGASSTPKSQIFILLFVSFVISILLKTILVFLTYNKIVPAVLESMDMKIKFQPINMYISAMIVFFVLALR
jgi:hypothetical protein